MLRMNQLSGFGGQGPSLLVRTASALNTDAPTFEIDLGPPGLKQVFIGVACYDVSGNDAWDWTVGTLGGEPLTQNTPPTSYNAGNGSNVTQGATIRSIQTHLGGVQTLSIGAAGFAGIMNEWEVMAIVTRGLGVTEISKDGGNNQVAATGNDVTLNTAGARIVIVVAGALNPGTLSGPGTEVTVVSTSRAGIGYDMNPAGGASDVYQFSGGKYVIAGAAFG